MEIMVSVGDKKQAGFGVAIIAVVVLVLAGLGLIGWRLYSQYNSKPVAQRTTTTQTSGNNQTSNSSAQQQQTDPNAGYVVIKEWSMRFKAVSGLSGVVYALADDNTINFSTQPLQNIDANCSAQTNPIIGKVVRSTDASTPSYIALGKVGNYYYYYYYEVESTCSDNPSATTLQTQMIQYFKESITSLEAVK